MPYKSAGLATVALLSGEVHFMVTNMATALPQVAAGKLKAIGVTSASRSPLAPELPTIAAAGIPGFEYSTWYGMLGPAGIPRSVVSTVHRDLKALAAGALLQERFSSQGLELQLSKPEEFAAYLSSEIAKWGNVVRTGALKID